MSRNKSIIERIDWISVLVYLILVFIGWINIYAAGYSGVGTEVFDFAEPHFKQLMWIGFSVVLIVVILLIDSKFYEAFAYVFFGLTIVLLIGVLGFGAEIKGAKSWIKIGAFSIQPAEFAKFGTALALSKLLTSYNFSLGKLKHMLWAFALIATPMALVLLQNDTGSAMVYATFALVLYREGLSPYFLLLGFLAILLFVLVLLVPTLMVYFVVFGILSVWLFINKDQKYAIVPLASAALSIAIYFGVQLFGVSINPLFLAYGTFGVIGVYFLLIALLKRELQYTAYSFYTVFSTFYIISTGYIFNKVLLLHQKSRIMVLLGLKDDPLGAGYNVAQSKIAIGSGGLTGKGFLKGTQTRMDFVPEQNTDFIFSTLGEEWGFLGALLVLSLFLFFILRIIYLAERQRSDFSRIYGYSVAMILFFHVAINVGMAIGVAPVIGIPLPFFSYGGSSLWGFTVLLFIFFRLDANRYELLK